MSTTDRATSRSGVLVIRVWEESGPNRWRVRVTRTHDVQEGVEETSLTESADQVCAIVRAWLDEFLASLSRDDGRPG